MPDEVERLRAKNKKLQGELDICLAAHYRAARERNVAREAIGLCAACAVELAQNERAGR